MVELNCHHFKLSKCIINNWNMNTIHLTEASCEYNINSALILKREIVGTSIENSLFYRSECENINNTNDNWPCHQSRFA